MLPAGGTAVYGFLGAQEIGGGYRQGLLGIELEGRVAFNYLLLETSGEILAKKTLLELGDAEVAPFLGIGLLYDSGSRYFDTSNFQHLGVRPRVGVAASYRILETLSAIAQLDVPWDIAVNPAQGWRFGALLGGGAEIFVGGGFSVGLLGQVGLDAIKEPQGVPQARVGYQVKLGLGYRLF